MSKDTCLSLNGQNWRVFRINMLQLIQKHEAVRHIPGTMVAKLHVRNVVCADRLEAGQRLKASLCSGG